MSMAFKITGFMFAISIAVTWVNAMGIFAGLSDTQGNAIVAWSNPVSEFIWLTVMPSGEDIPTTRDVSDYFRGLLILLIGGLAMIGDIILNMVGGTMYTLVRNAGLPPLIAIGLQNVAYLNYYLLIAEWRSGRQIRGMY